MYKSIIFSLIFLICNATAKAAMPENYRLSPLNQIIFLQEIPLDTVTRQWLEKKNTVIVGVSRDNLEPFNVFNNNEYEGVVADYLSLISRSLNINVRIKVFNDIREGRESLLRGDIDVLTDINTIFDNFSKISGVTLVPFLTNYPLSIWRLVSESKIDERQPELRVGYISGTIDPKLVKQSFSNAEIISYKNDKEALNGLISHETDGVVGDLISSSYLVNQYHIKGFRIQKIITPKELTSNFVFRNNDSILSTAFSQALARITATQQKDLLHRWEGGGVVKITDVVKLGLDDHIWLQNHKKISVGVIDYFAPFSYFDSKGNFNGITSDLLEQIELLTGMSFEIKKYNNIAELLNSVKNGEVDIAADITPSPRRNNPFLYSRSYISSNFVLVTRTDDNEIESLKGLKNKKLAILKGHFLLPFLKKNYPYINCVEVDQIVDGYEMVKSGKASAFIQAINSADFYLSRIYKNKLQFKSVITDTGAKFSFVVNKSNPQLLNIINASLSEFTPDELAGIASRWRTDAPIENPFWEKYREIIYIWVIIIIIIMLLAMMRFFYLHKILAHQKISEKN